MVSYAQAVRAGCGIISRSVFRRAVARPIPAAVTLVKAGRLFDPRTGKVLSPAAVLIENGKIKEVGSPLQVQGNAPAGVKTIDLGSATRTARAD